MQGRYFPPAEAEGGWRTLVQANETPNAGEKRDILEITGLDWDRLREAWDLCRKFGDPNSLLVIRHGWIAGEWYDDTGPHRIASCTKSLTALAMAKIFDLSDAGKLPGKISIEDDAWRWLPSEWVEIDPRRKEIKLRHLLTMSSGLTPLDSNFDEIYYQRIMEEAVEAPPGTIWAYSSGPVDLLSLVVEKATGRVMGDFFHDEIHGPIGGERMSWGAFGSHTGGSGGPGGGARFSARELARVGYLVLHDGTWESQGERRQMLTSGRLRELTRHAPFLDACHWRQPNFAFEPHANRYYGYLWWTNLTGQGLGEAAPRDIVYMSGWGKQACFVAPGLDMVVARLGANSELARRPLFYHELWERLMGAVAG